MKKTMLMALLLTLGGVLASQAVVIGWASESLPNDTALARLIYVADGNQPSLDGGGNWSAGVSMVSDYAQGYAIDGSTLYSQQATDATTRSAGAYYIVLFNAAMTEYSVSATGLAYNDGPSISTGEFDPLVSDFSPTAFTDWGAVPEPSTAMLLVFGAAVTVLRRRKRV